MKKNDDDAGCRIPRLRHQPGHDFSYDTYRSRHIGTYEKLRESLFRDVTLSLTASEVHHPRLSCYHHCSIIGA